MSTTGDRLRIGQRPFEHPDAPALIDLAQQYYVDLYSRDRDATDADEANRMFVVATARGSGIDGAYFHEKPLATSSGSGRT
jgi:hypothetical protein